MSERRILVVNCPASATHKTTFSSSYALPDFRHSFMSVRRIDGRPWNETKWVFAAIPGDLWRRQVLLETVVAAWIDHWCGTRDCRE